MVGESEPDKLFTAHRILHMAISGCRACAKEAFHTPSDLHLREARMGSICKSSYKDIFKKFLKKNNNEHWQWSNVLIIYHLFAREYRVRTKTKGAAPPFWRGSEVVITRRSWKPFVLTGTWVRIPSSPLLRSEKSLRFFLKSVIKNDNI